MFLYLCRELLHIDVAAFLVNRNLAAEDELIRSLEREGLNVILVFSYSVKDDDLGTRSMGEVVWDYFFIDGKPITDAMVKTAQFFRGQDRNNMGETKGNQTGIVLLKKMNVPVFEPLLSTRMTLDEWENSIGLSTDIGWAVAMPEFKGMIEPIIISARSKQGDYEELTAIPERCAKLAKRVKKWTELARKPITERRAAFIFHNNPCASVEA
jgi:cobaltochelatase CobN